MRVQRKVGVSRNRKAVHSERVQRLIRLKLGRRRPLRSEFGETVGDEEDEDDENAIGGAFDLEVAEERVGTEEVEGFVDDVGCVWVGWM